MNFAAAPQGIAGHDCRSFYSKVYGDYIAAAIVKGQKDRFASHRRISASHLQHKFPVDQLLYDIGDRGFGQMQHFG